MNTQEPIPVWEAESAVGKPPEDMDLLSYLPPFMAAYRELQPLNGELAVLHDPACVLFCLNKNLAAQSRRYRATVSIDHGETAGALIADPRAAAYDQGNLLAVTQIDKDRVLSDLISLLKKAP